METAEYILGGIYIVFIICFLIWLFRDIVFKIEEHPLLQKSYEMEEQNE